MPQLTEDLKNKNLKPPSALLQMLALSVAVGLVAGVMGAVYVAPWYEQNILERDGRSAENRKIILDEESAVIEAVKAADPAVVSIVVTRDLPKLQQFGSPFGDFFFTLPSGETETQQVGAGSGFFVKADGWVVTNKHVVADTQAEYTVITKDGSSLKATVLATDPFNDLAIVKVEGDGFPTLPLGDSDNLVLGQRVIAIGNALGEFQNTVTTGVVSGIARNITASTGAQTENLSEVIQTDAAINPGNSGGPLLNLAGEVVGVNTAVSQQAQLIGFAIPVEQLKKVVSDVEEHGKVLRPFLGIRYTVITPGFAEASGLPVQRGVLIVEGANPQEEPAVQPGSPAEQAGLAAGDIVLEIEGEKITPKQQLTDILRKWSPGDKVVLKVRKAGGEETTVLVTLGEAQ